MHPVPAQPACCARLLSKDVHDATRGLLVEVDRIRSRIEHRFVFKATHQLGHARLRSVRTSTSRSEGTACDSKYTCQDPKQIAIRNHSTLHYEAMQRSNTESHHRSRWADVVSRYPRPLLGAYGPTGIRGGTTSTIGGISGAGTRLVDKLVTLQQHPKTKQGLQPSDDWANKCGSTRSHLTTQNHR